MGKNTVENIGLKRDKMEKIALMVDIGERLRKALTGKGRMDELFD